MPVVKIDMWKGRTGEQKEILIKKITDSFEAIDVPTEHITVIINEVDKDNWGISGTQASKIK